MQFLTEMITKYAYEDNLTTANNEINATSSLSNEQSNWKRARLELISKHAGKDPTRIQKTVAARNEDPSAGVAGADP